MARCARDVLSRDAPRETGCSRSAYFRVLFKHCGTPFDHSGQDSFKSQRLTPRSRT